MQFCAKIKKASFFIIIIQVHLSLTFELTIIHTNDVHSRFEQANKYGSFCSEYQKYSGRCFGGAARRAMMIKQIRNQYKNTILLDAGDQFQGTVWFYVYKGQATAHFMNMMKYDAMAVGNHEFDLGPQKLAAFIRNITFPMLASNMDTRDSFLAGLVKKSTILNINGENIGIVGYTTTDMRDLSNPGKNTKFYDEIPTIQEEVNKLKRKGVNKILALGHSGYHIDQKIAREVNGIDAVIGGHTHTFLYTGKPPSIEKSEGPYPTLVRNTASGRLVPVVQAHTTGKYLGFLQLIFTDNGDVTSWKGEPILLDNKIPRDQKVLRHISIWRRPVENARHQVVGRSNVFLDGDRHTCRQRECNLGNMITDAIVGRQTLFAEKGTWTRAAIAVWNSGGIRASLEKGDITIEDIISVAPFRNTIDILYIKGYAILSFLEHAVSHFDPNVLPGALLQVSGMKIVYDLSKEPGERVVSVHVRCHKCLIPEFLPLEEETVYPVLVPLYLQMGGDGHHVFKENYVKRQPIGELDTDIIIDYFKTRSPVTVGTEGRIKFIIGAEELTERNVLMYHKDKAVSWFDDTIFF